MPLSRRWFPSGPALILFLPALLLFAGAAAWKQWGVPPARVAGNLRTFRITEGQAVDVSPSFSPDAKRIAYASNRTGKFRVYIRTVEPGGHAGPFGPDMEESPEPAWSPDGANIAYASNDGIYAISAEGGQPRRITEIGTQPAWSPASDSIVFASESRLMRAPSRGGQPAYLTEPNNPPGKHDSPVWSNDGKHILFISRENAGDTIWSIGLADRALQKIPLPQGHYFSAVYSHDSKGIFYSEQTTDGLNHISIMLLDDDSPRPVELKVAGTTAQRGLRLSRDGRRLAYVLEPPAAVSGIYVVDLK